MQLNDKNKNNINHGVNDVKNGLVVKHQEKLREEMRDISPSMIEIVSDLRPNDTGHRGNSASVRKAIEMREIIDRNRRKNVKKKKRQNYGETQTLSGYACYFLIHFEWFLFLKTIHFCPR
jgi:hypothetical protein